MRVILQDKFWVVHIPFVRMVKSSLIIIIIIIIIICEFSTPTIIDSLSQEIE